MSKSGSLDVEFLDMVDSTQKLKFLKLGKRGMSWKDEKRWILGIQETDTNLREMMKRNQARERRYFQPSKTRPFSFKLPVLKAEDKVKDKTEEINVWDNEWDNETEPKMPVLLPESEELESKLHVRKQWGIFSRFVEATAAKLGFTGLSLDLLPTLPDPCDSTKISVGDDSYENFLKLMKTQEEEEEESNLNDSQETIIVDYLDEIMQ